MSADRTAKISSSVRKVFDSPSEGMCATIEIVGKREAWAQVMKGTLNAAYPLEASPESRLSEILARLPGSVITAWEPATFVTVSFDSASPTDVANAIEHHFEKFFDADVYSVDCRLEEM